MNTFRPIHIKNAYALHFCYANVLVNVLLGVETESAHLCNFNFLRLCPHIYCITPVNFLLSPVDIEFDMQRCWYDLRVFFFKETALLIGLSNLLNFKIHSNVKQIHTYVKVAIILSILILLKYFRLSSVNLLTISRLQRLKLSLHQRKISFLVQSLKKFSTNTLFQQKRERKEKKRVSLTSIHSNAVKFSNFLSWFWMQSPFNLFSCHEQNVSYDEKHEFLHMLTGKGYIHIQHPRQCFFQFFKYNSFSGKVSLIQLLLFHFWCCAYASVCVNKYESRKISKPTKRTKKKKNTE